MKKALCIVLTFIICFNCCTAFAQNTEEVLKDTKKFLLSSVAAPSVSSVGGEWLVTGLARSGLDIPQNYFESYYNNVCNYVKERNGVLHQRKYTEYSRVVIALTSIGKNPADVAGHNLIEPLCDFDKVVLQGLNGPVWALIALDCGKYIYSSQVQAARKAYVERILEREIQGGGWALNQKQTTPDVDITAMALVALSPYRSDERVADAIERGLNVLSLLQEESGGYSSYNNENFDSSAQVLTAISSLGISCEDSRFVKNGNTLKDHLFSFYKADGGFAHTGNQSDLMATEQAFYALVAADRYEKGKTSLFSMTSAEIIPFSTKVINIIQSIFERIN